MPIKSVQEQALRQFVVATPQRSVCDDNARVLEQAGRLRFLALGTRRGTQGVPQERTRLNPWIGLWTYVGARTLSPYNAESFRFHLLPWFDSWALRQLEPGNHIISSYGYANKCFRFVQQHGGKTFVDAGNSHIENFWEVLCEEHRRWNCPRPPVSPFWYERSRAMLSEGADYVLSPSSYVTKSFLCRGYRPEQILTNIYPVNLSVFQPPPSPKPRNRPLRVINTGNLSLRKGTPYLLEALRLVRQQSPSAKFMLTKSVRDDVKSILARYRDLPIEWADSMPHAQLAERLRSADVFVLPSLEEGLVRTALEAMACGLQVVLTPHCGANDFVEQGVNGEVVPIRDPKAIAEAIMKCWERVREGEVRSSDKLKNSFSFETFAQEFLRQLKTLKIFPESCA